MKRIFDTTLSRRSFLTAAGVLWAGFALDSRLFAAAERGPSRRRIPGSGETVPVIGMGTWQTFDVGNDPEMKSRLQAVLQAFFRAGGRLVDSSPMYGRSEAVVGELLHRIGRQDEVFAATKVWTDGRRSGISQMKRSMERMGVSTMDLMQIHNLRDWQTHLPVLRKWKAEGKIRYIGVTTSHGRYHSQLERIMKTEALDFVQLTYNIGNRTAEERLLPLAADRGMATIVNRPFGGGGLFRRVKGIPLPEWSIEFDCNTWGQYFLKFVASHPAVTCAIPATSKVRHMKDNMGAGFGRMPDAKTRERMLRHFTSLQE